MKTNTFYIIAKIAFKFDKSTSKHPWQDLENETQKLYNIPTHINNVFCLFNVEVLWLK